MAKKINLPKAQVSSQGDLITIVQNGVEKYISKKDLLKYLEDSLSKLSTDITSVKRQVTKRTISVNAPSFNSPISAKDPVSNKHLTTKQYEDSTMHNVVKNDGTTPLLNNLYYRNSPKSFTENDIITRKFVDDELKATLKTIKKSKGDLGYPKASAGDVFLIKNEYAIFATDGPEI